MVVSPRGWRAPPCRRNATGEPVVAEGVEGRMNEQRSDLVAIIHDVRRRWRMKLLVRGAALAAGCAALALVLSALGLQWNRFTPESILLFRIVMAIVAG